ncbi:MAG: hypothetical protein JXR64_04990 [Spirochaetales bacterium]|nr:hypothetical protein [Spirochaetales bacterium]
MFDSIEANEVIKINQDGLEAMMHGLKSNGFFYTLTLKDSSKVERLKDTNKLKFSFKNSDLITGEAEIIENKDLVKELFNKMLELNFTHFKIFNDNLVIFKIKEI